MKIKKRIFCFLLSLVLFITLSACQNFIQDSEPETPPPELEQTAYTADMKPLIDALLNYCHDELAELGGYSVSRYGIAEDFPQSVNDIYGISPDYLADGFIIDDSGGSPFELAVLRAAEQDEDTLNLCMDRLNAYKKSVKERFSVQDEDGHVFIPPENEEAYAYVTDGGVMGINGYEALLICRGAKGAAGVFERTVLSMSLSAEGEEDASHPGRRRYVPPNKDDMSVYDISQITDAWARKNPDTLSDYDRAVYDGAEEILKNVIQDDMSDFDKEAALYEWVIQNVEYDWSHMDPLTETPRESYTPYGGIVEHKAVCLGYAASFQLLAEMAGIECIVVVGANGGEDHAWNMVRIHGEWYCADPTWDKTYCEDGKNGREWLFFNTTSDYMARTEHQWDYDNVPEATKDDYGYPAQ